MDAYRRRADQNKAALETSARTSRVSCSASRVRWSSFMVAQPDEVDNLRLLLNQSEQQCNILRLDLQRVHTDNEILKIRLIEQKMMDSTSSGPRY